MNTTSAWKTKTFTEEVQEYKRELMAEIKKITDVTDRLYNLFNES